MKLLSAVCRATGHKNYRPISYLGSFGCVEDGGGGLMPPPLMGQSRELPGSGENMAAERPQGG